MMKKLKSLNKDIILVIIHKYLIYEFSPVAQVIGMRPGQICEITRSSKTAIDTLFIECVNMLTIYIMPNYTPDEYKERLNNVSISYSSLLNKDYYDGYEDMKHINTI